MNTYLLYCRFQKMRGGFTEAEYEQRDRAACSETLAAGIDEPHWQRIPGRLGLTPRLRQSGHDR